MGARQLALLDDHDKMTGEHRRFDEDLALNSNRSSLTSSWSISCWEHPRMLLEAGDIFWYSLPHLHKESAPHCRLVYVRHSYEFCTDIRVPLPRRILILIQSSSLQLRIEPAGQSTSTWTSYHGAWYFRYQASCNAVLAPTTIKPAHSDLSSFLSWG